MKDHLGNTRVVFGEKNSAAEYKATMENSMQSDETTTFKNYTSGVRSALPLFDHTDEGTTYTYSQLLNGGSNSQVGLAKSFEVNSGDVFDLEVYAKYEALGSSPPNNVNGLLSALISAFSLGAGTTPLDGSQAQSKFNDLFSGGPLINSSQWENDQPKAYLNYILFDENFNLADFGFDQITAGKQVGVSPDVDHDYLSLHVQVQQKGYLYIYISNEDEIPTNVYFDDMKIVRYTAVEQVNDYYAFGLTFNSYSRENATPNDNKYNGKEEQKELGLGWLDYGARMYMPELGRWGVTDPLSNRMYNITPYSYAFNNPSNFIDHNGEIPVPVIYLVYEGMVYAFTASAAMYVVTNHDNLTKGIYFGGGSHVLEARGKAKDPYWAPYVWKPSFPLDVGQPMGNNMEPEPHHNSKDNKPGSSWRRLGIAFFALQGLRAYQEAKEQIAEARNELQQRQNSANKRIDVIYQRLDELYSSNMTEQEEEEYSRLVEEKSILQELRNENAQTERQLNQLDQGLEESNKRQVHQQDGTRRTDGMYSQEFLDWYYKKSSLKNEN